MARWKKLRGVAHNFAHHCQSGLSYIQPHISNELEKIQKKSTTIFLIPDFTTELELKKTNPLFLALVSAQKKFQSILELNGFKIDEVKSLQMDISLQKYGDYNSSVKIEIETKDGHTVTGFVNYITS